MCMYRKQYFIFTQEKVPYFNSERLLIKTKADVGNYNLKYLKFLKKPFQIVMKLK